jgi:hypothetical protein
MLGDDGAVASTEWETGLGNQLHVRNDWAPGAKGGEARLLRHGGCAQQKAFNHAFACALRVSSALVRPRRALFRCWSLGAAMKVRR